MTTRGYRVRAEDLVPVAWTDPWTPTHRELVSLWIEIARALGYLVTVSDLQRELRIGRVQAYELAHALPHIRIGKSIRIERADYEAWKAQQKTGVGR